MNKTVYVLGAGFSRHAGAPSQAEILKEIISLQEPSPSDLLWPKYDKSRRELFSFIEETFHQTTSEENTKVPLEDIFTFIDKALLVSSMFHGIPVNKIEEFKEALNLSIVYMFDQKLKGGCPPFYHQLAWKIVKRRKDAGQKGDPLALINLNWDIILDNVIHDACDDLFPETRTDRAGVDYCCSATSTITGKRTNNLKSEGGYNIKILKLHGSLNWFYCNNCGRLFYETGKKVTLMTFFEKARCSFCGRNDSPQKLFITPTLLKDLNNTHLKMVWHNAEIELSEADRIVFVGYSLPLADFEFRFSLKKSIRKKARIIVVLKSGKHYQETSERYKVFFGQQLMPSDILGCGSENFFAKEFSFDPP